MKTQEWIDFYINSLKLQNGLIAYYKSEKSRGSGMKVLAAKKEIKYIKNEIKRLQAIK